MRAPLSSAPASAVDDVNYNRLFLWSACLGGADFIKAVSAPYAHTALRMIPLGGIGEENLSDYLTLPIVIAVGGSWLNDRKLAAAGRWDEISSRTKRAVHLAALRT